MKNVNTYDKPLAKKTESKPNKTKTKKPEKAGEKGERYYCEICGCEMVCIEASAEAIVCCNEPMLLICE